MGGCIMCICYGWELVFVVLFVIEIVVFGVINL